jgi:hypothetical protein
VPEPDIDADLLSITEDVKVELDVRLDALLNEILDVNVLDPLIAEATLIAEAVVPVADKVLEAEDALEPLNVKEDASVDFPEIDDADEPVGLAVNVDDALIPDVSPMAIDELNVLDALNAPDLGNVGPATIVLDADTAAVRGNVGAPTTVEDDEIADEYENEYVADTVLLLLICATPTNTGDELNVLLEDIDDERTKDADEVNVLLDDIDADRWIDGVAVSVAEPLRLATPLVVKEGAASLAAINATVM